MRKSQTAVSLGYCMKYYERKEEKSISNSDIHWDLGIDSSILVVFLYVSDSWETLLMKSRKSWCKSQSYERYTRR